LQAAGFQQKKEVGVSMHYGVSTSKGGRLMVAKAKHTVPGSWMRLGFLGKWLSVGLVKHM